MSMKRFLTLILSLMLVLTLIGCGAGNRAIKQENGAWCSYFSPQFQGRGE